MAPFYSAAIILVGWYTVLSILLYLCSCILHGYGCLEKWTVKTLGSHKASHLVPQSPLEHRASRSHFIYHHVAQKKKMAPSPFYIIIRQRMDTAWKRNANYRKKAGCFYLFQRSWPLCLTKATPTPDFHDTVLPHISIL